MKKLILSSIIFLVIISFTSPPLSAGETSKKSKKKVKEETALQFLKRSGFSPKAKIKLARFTAVVRTKTVVKSIVKVIPQGTPGRHLERLLHHILHGKKAELRPTEKIGELEIYFQDQRKFTVLVGKDLFQIKTSIGEYTFESEELEKLIQELLVTKLAK